MADTARDDLQRQADGYVRQGRLDAAIGAFEQLVRLPPTDWNVVKQLADLQERAGHREAAATRFLQCADYYFDEGFLARAAALYRKVLKLEAKSEHALGKLADVSLELKLKMDARQALVQLVALRRERGNAQGAQEAAARLAALDGAEVLIRAPRPPEPPAVLDVQAHVEPEPEPIEAVLHVDVSDDGNAGPDHPDQWASLLSAAQPPTPASWSVPASPVAPAPPVADHVLPPAAGTGAFDWGALLGREVEPPSARAVPSPPDDDPGDVTDPADAVASGQADEEVDLTDLLDQLAADRVPNVSASGWQRADVPITPPDTAPPDSFERPPLAGFPDASFELLALPATGSEGPSDADPRAVAARQLAAGRVFAAAGLAAEAARAFERASRDARTRFEAAEALGTLHRSRGQHSEAVRWYDEASQAPVADEAVRRPVLYDLAEVLEAVGQPGRALAILLELLSDVDDYRDARARAERLLRVDAGG